MSNNNTMTHITLWVMRCIAVCLVILIPFMPSLLDWYGTTRVLSHAKYMAILLAFYCSTVVTLPALWQLDKLLRNILAGQVFVRRNLTCIRWVQWCCLGVSLICLPAACVYLPLFFVVILTGFLTLMITVVVRVMAAAVEIREENDLTI